MTIPFVESVRRLFDRGGKPRAKSRKERIPLGILRLEERLLLTVVPGENPLALLGDLPVFDQALAAPQSPDSTPTDPPPSAPPTSSDAPDPTPTAPPSVPDSLQPSDTGSVAFSFANLSDGMGSGLLFSPDMVEAGEMMPAPEDAAFMPDPGPWLPEGEDPGELPVPATFSADWLTNDAWLDEAFAREVVPVSDDGFAPTVAAPDAPDLFAQLASSSAGQGQTFDALNEHFDTAADDQDDVDQGGGIPTSAAPPAPAVDTETRVDSRAYARHYTYTASNATSAYSLEVWVRADKVAGGEMTATVSYVVALASTTAAPVTFSETVAVAQPADVFAIPYPYAGSTPPLLGLGGVPNPLQPGFDWSGVMAATDWTSQRWTDSVTDATRGTYLEANGVRYRFATFFTSTDDRKHLWSGPDQGAGTQTFEYRHSGGYKSDVTYSDKDANFAASLALGTDGRPTDLFAPAAADTTYLKHTFDARMFSELQTTATTRDAQDVVTGVDYDSNSSYDGVAGYRYHFDASVTTGDRNKPGDTAEDRTSWLIDYRQKGTYAGGDVARQAWGGADGFIDTATATRQDAGTVLADRYGVTNDYFRRANGYEAEGTASYGRAGLGPATYSNWEGATKSRGEGGQALVDSATFRYRRDSASEWRSAGQGSYRGTDRAAGVRSGESRGAYFDARGGASWLSSDVGGTLDLLAGGGTTDVALETAGSGWSVSAGASRREVDAGSAVWDAIDFASSSEAGWSERRAAGALDAEGGQVSGYADQGGASAGQSASWAWARGVAPDYPTWTSLETGTGARSHGEQSELTFAPAGASGTLASSAQAADDSTLLVVQKGRWKLTDGFLDVDEHDRRRTQAASSTATALTLTAGVAAGTTAEQETTAVTYDNRQARDLVRRRGALLLIAEDYDAEASGKAVASDLVVAPVGGPAAAPTRATYFSQKGQGKSRAASDGWLADAAGHSGFWKRNVESSSSVDDEVTAASSLGEAGWAETGRTFRTLQEARRKERFEQRDDGLGHAAAPGVRRVHEVEEDEQSHARKSAQGSAGDFTFAHEGKSEATRTEFASAYSAGPAAGGGTQTRLFVEAARDRSVQEAVRAGRDVGGDVTVSKVRLFLRGERDRSNATWVERPNYKEDYGSASSRRMEESRDGDWRQGTGWRKSGGDDATWKRVKDDTGLLPGVPKFWGKRPGPAQLGARADLSWGLAPPQDLNTWNTFWQDFANDPAVAWAYENGADLLRIAGGVIEVASGVGMALGSGGVAIFPAAVLMAVGIDQILTGVENIRAGKQAQSVFEFLGYAAAVWGGAEESAAHTIGAVTPAVLSLGAGGMGGVLARGPARRALAFAEEITGSQADLPNAARRAAYREAHARLIRLLEKAGIEGSPSRTR